MDTRTLSCSPEWLTLPLLYHFVICMERNFGVVEQQRDAFLRSHFIYLRLIYRFVFYGWAAGG